MKKITLKIISSVLTVALLLCSVPMTGLNMDIFNVLSKAEELQLLPSGYCGDEATYTFDSETGLLEISGTGAIKSDLFAGNQIIKSLVIKDGIKSIESTFENCRNLESVTIASTTTKVCSRAFANCEGLRELTMPCYIFLGDNRVNSVSSGVFYNTKNIEKVTIKSGKGGFFGTYSDNPTTTDLFTKFASYNLPWDSSSSQDSIKEIIIKTSNSISSTTCLENCTNLRSISYERFVVSGFIPFTNSNYIEKLDMGSLDKFFEYGYKNLVQNSAETLWDFYTSDNLIEDLVVPDSVTELKPQSLISCKSIKTVTIPAYVTKIGARVFDNCPNLTDIYYEGKSEMWNTIDIDEDNEFLTNTTIHFSGNSEESGHCGDDATYTFDSKTGLLEISGTGVVNYDKYINNKEVKSLVVNEGITELRISFYECDKLEYVKLADSVTYVKSQAFSYCDNLKELIMPCSVFLGSVSDKQKSLGVFYNTKNIEKVTMTKGSGKSLQATYLTLSPSEFHRKFFYSSLPWVDDSSASSIKEIIVEDGVEAIYFLDTLKYCHNIESISFGADYKTEFAAFTQSPNINKLNMNNLDTFFKYGFKNLIQNSATTLWDFYTNDTLIENLVVPDSVTELKSQSLISCKSIKTATIPVSVNKIGASVFDNCPNLTDIYYNGTVEMWNTLDIDENNEFLTNTTIHFVDTIDNSSVNEILFDKLTVNNDYISNITVGMSIADLQTKAPACCTISTDSNADRIGTGTVIKVTYPNTTTAEYTAIVFGDSNGDGWYDGADAVIVSCIANGMLTKEQVSEAVWTAADCNHDGVIDELDVALLEQAGVLLQDVDQSKSTEELLATSSAYNEYVNLISQNPTVDDEPTDEGSQMTLIDRIIAFVMKFVEYIKSSLGFFIKKV